MLTELVFPIGRCGDFSIYLPKDGEDWDAELRRALAANAANAETLEENPPPGRAGRITASFIYAHPADYRGRPMLSPATDDWRRALRDLKRMGMDTVIFQAALWSELSECYYVSRRYRHFKTFRVIEPMLEAAQREGMTVYLGGYGSVTGWRENVGEGELRSELKEHRACFRELAALGEFAGMYFPCETAYAGFRQTEKENRMRRLYRGFSDMVKEHDPSMKIITSPASIHHPGKEDEFLAFWDAVLAGSGLDVVMPQDCVGNCLCLLRDMPAIWRLWRRLADRFGLELWSHTEVFERRSFFADTNLFPATPARVERQLQLSSPHVDKHCCWEAQYFASPLAGSEGKILRSYLRKNTNTPPSIPSPK